MTKNVLMNLIAGAALVLVAGIAGAADDPAAAQARQQAIESLQKNLAKNPNDQGLKQALSCVERSAQCTDTRGLDRAIERVKQQSAKDPKDEGLKQALHQLEQHHQTLGKPHSEREGAMHREDMRGDMHRPDAAHPGDMMRPDAPHRPDMPDSTHR